ncbi:MAG: AAA family ATPase [Alicyclobacillus mali]|uniref:AAA family ATPase n=1 Tax=Alicyclobacillus mali (ex Roth et al. 2021) TaxID=1123961 RepID=UPI0023F2189A|nr:AAA family ATPase [Alicyclobacillus mali (ex Roth et al. 2021)]MCL6489904.1 AAA family ATPase [Alicyclobacillus mali (ex Roth et al. 2021)]
MERRFQHVFLMGPMGAGKSTVAQYLRREMEYVRYSLATPVEAVLDIAAPWLRDASKAVRRPYLQKVGRFLREFKPNPLFLAAEEVLKHTTSPMVIDDGRTVEEAVWADQHGFLVVILTASEFVRRRRILERDGELPDGRTHEDETEQQWKYARGLVIDTSDLTEDEMCEMVRAAIESRRMERCKREERRTNGEA